MPMILGAATLGRNDGAGDARSVTKAAQNPRDTTRGDTMPTKDFDSMEDSNRSSNPSIHDLSDPARRTVLRGSLGLAAAALYGPLVAGCLGRADRRGRQHAGLARRRLATAPPTRRCRWACTTTASISTRSQGSSTRGLLAMNHEYTDDGLLHSGGMASWSAEKVRKSQAAHGVSVIEVELKGDGLADGPARAAMRGASPPTRRSRWAGRRRPR
jgi:hypothetical protein